MWRKGNLIHSYTCYSDKLIHIGGNVSWYNHCGKQDESVKETKEHHHVTQKFHPCVCIREKNKNTNLNSFMHPKFTAALFTVAKIMKPPKCSLTNIWIKKIWYTHIAAYCSPIRNMKFLLFNNMAAHGKYYKCEISQIYKDKY